MFASKDLFLTPPSGGYSIARSVRLRQSASAYFNRTAGVAPTSNQKGTFSFWFKRGSLATGSEQWLFAGGSNSLGCGIPTNNVMFIEYFGGLYLYTTQVFRDPSAWYHMVFAIDTTQATAANRAKLYINGVQVTSFTTEQYPSQNATFNWMASGQACYINQIYSGGRYFDGYMAEFNYIDGQQLTPSSFGETDSITGVWKPKAYSGTYGTNGFELNFSDNSNNTAATIGKDYSGNGNNWTPNNISVTAGVTYDSMVDSPTVGATSSNYCVLNPLDAKSGATISQGNLGYVSNASGRQPVRATIGVSSGKWYFEFYKNSSQSGSVGFATNTTPLVTDGYAGDASTSWGYLTTGNKANNATTTAYGNTWTAGDVIGVALDLDNGKIWFSKNNTWQASGSPTSGTNAAYTNVTGTLLPILYTGSDSTVDNVNFGQQPFSYTPPTGFVALNTYNLPASIITNGAAYMAATTYTGDGASTKSFSNAVNGVSFQPDMVWSRIRAGTPQSIGVFDSIRGTTGQSLDTAATTVEGTWMGVNASDYGYVSAFDSGGFSVNDGAIATTGGYVNFSTRTYVGWQWKAGTTSASNTNGSITSTVSAGATQGFSVVTYTGNGSSSATVGHGLGAIPSMIISKSRSGTTTSWFTKHISLASNLMLTLDTTDATYNGSLAGSGGLGNLTSSTTFGFVNGTSNVNNVNASGSTYVAYCFSAVAGYSAFGSYTGNGSSDGPFIYTGFRPRWVMIKCTTDAGQVWLLLDTSRSPYNIAQETIYANESSAEATNPRLDFLSNGIKIRNTYGNQNTNGSTYIYACFAENPFKNALAR